MLDRSTTAWPLDSGVYVWVVEVGRRGVVRGLMHAWCLYWLESLAREYQDQLERRHSMWNYAGPAYMVEEVSRPEQQL